MKPGDHHDGDRDQHADDRHGDDAGHHEGSDGGELRAAPGAPAGDREVGHERIELGVGAGAQARGRGAPRAPRPAAGPRRRPGAGARPPAHDPNRRPSDSRAWPYRQFSAARNPAGWKNLTMDLGLADVRPSSPAPRGASAGRPRSLSPPRAPRSCPSGATTTRLAAAAGECRAAGARAEILALDVTDPDAGERAVSACQQAFGRSTCSSTAPGTSSVRAIDALTDDEWQAQWELHVMAPMRLMRAAAPADGAARLGPDRQRLLLLGQAALLDQRRLLGDQGGRSCRSRAPTPTPMPREGVLVNAVAPGPGRPASCGWRPAGSPTRTRRPRASAARRCSNATAGRVPLRRMGTEDEIAAVIVFLCSERASNVAGAAWSVDGGSVPVII